MRDKELKIEKGIPFNEPYPLLRESRHLGLLKKMEVGDSVFFIDSSDSANFCTAARNIGIVCVRRKKAGGYRVWRVQ